MNNQPIIKSLPGRLLRFIAVMVNALLPVLPLKLGSNSLSSVSWNG